MRIHNSYSVFGQLTIDKSAALVDIEANSPTGCGDTENLPRLSSLHNHVCFYDVVSFKAHGGDQDYYLIESR